jgi:hypothetical protein
MPRPEKKPPTEGGKIIEINKEYVDLSGDVSENNVNEKLAKIYTFFVKKVAQLEIRNYELKQQIKDLSEG